MMDKFIFALDPSINNVGWCYLFCNNNQLTLLDCGIFHNNLEGLVDKMNYIFNQVFFKIQSLNVDAVVVEETLVNINPFTSLKLSKGQSASICGSFNHGAPVYVYSCKSPRKALLDNGNADKKQCRAFIENIVGRVANEHIADAILLGYFHHYKQINPQLFINSPHKKKKKSKKQAVDKLLIVADGNVAISGGGNGEITGGSPQQKKSKQQPVDKLLIVGDGNVPISGGGKGKITGGFPLEKQKKSKKQAVDKLLIVADGILPTITTPKNKSKTIK
jgi:crossover junction endodeoxyribonuclease RuvC